MNISGVKAVLFDLDGTLTDHLTAMNEALDVWCSQLGLPTGQHERFQEIETRWFHRFERGECSHQGQRIGRTREFTGRELSEAKAIELFQEYLAAYAQRWQAYPDAVACVQRALDAGLRVGILTNGRADMQSEKMRAGGVDLPGVELFATVDMGTPKPQPGAYLQACEALGVRPEETVMIGDNWANDVAGARAAGLSAVYIPRDNPQSPAPPAAAAEEAIVSLDEVTFAPAA